MEKDLTPIIELVVTLLMAILTTIVVPFVKQRVSSAKFEKIRQWIKIAVQGAEMIFKGSGMGKEKKEYVIQFMKNKGYKIDPDSLDVLIESAVLELKLTALEA